MTRRESLPGLHAVVALVLAALMTAAFVVNGCKGKSSGGGFLIASYSDLKPDKLLLNRASLELAGTEYKGDIKLSRNGDEVQIDLIALGQVIESERYVSTDETFSVVDAGGERYEAPIPLIKYGMHVGDEWEWKGKLWTGPTPHEATAKIKTASEDMTIGGGTVHNVVRVDVERMVDSGRPNEPSKQVLRFWIAPGMGVVKRAFGDYSVRRPLED